MAKRHLSKSIRGRGMTRDTKGETDTREETASLVSAVWVSRLLVTLRLNTVVLVETNQRC